MNHYKENMGNNPVSRASQYHLSLSWPLTCRQSQTVKLEPSEYRIPALNPSNGVKVKAEAIDSATVRSSAQVHQEWRARY
jgi:hypothetical protein